MPYDATGAFRLYRLDKIPEECFCVERSQGYSFFFESLFILFKNRFKIKEVAIDLPARTYGQSKMKFRDAFNSLMLLFKMVLLNIFSPKVFLIDGAKNIIQQNAEVVDDQGWDEYWEKQQSVNNWFYDHIAEFFRQFIIKPYLNKFIHKYFSRGAKLLHAGCGSGQVDLDITKEYSVLAMDISLNALKIYREGHSRVEGLIQNDIRKMDLENDSVDGIYSLGVMEHFCKSDILMILNEFHRVLKPAGSIVLFWPPKYGLSVYFLQTWHFILNKILKKNIRLHPLEVSLLESRDQIVDYGNRTGFTLSDYHFGMNDLFTQVVIVLKKDR
jgi:ubiquinone/menaquinone biosynthesis C-methylase UbiE